MGEPHSAVHRDLLSGNCDHPTLTEAARPRCQPALPPALFPRPPARCAIAAADSWGGGISLALLMLWSILVIIVLVNFLIAVVTNTFQTIKDREELQHLRNQAAVIDEIEGRMAGRQGQQQAVRDDRPFLHVLTPRQEVEQQRGEGGAAHPEAQRIEQLQRDVRGLVQGQQQLEEQLVQGQQHLAKLLRELLKSEPAKSDDQQPMGDGGSSIDGEGEE